MARTTGGRHGDVRQSALWGSGKGGGEHRSNALWGKGGRSAATACIALLAFALPASAVANNKSNPGGKAYLSDGLYGHAAKSPGKKFEVIVEAASGKGTNDARAMIGKHNGQLRHSFKAIPAVAATLNGQQLLKLAEEGDIASITLDSPVRSTAYQDSEMWRSTAGVTGLYGSLLSPAPQAPAIAIVDSGVDSSKLQDFGSRVVAQTVICSLCAAGASGDNQGHGTMVAGLAAGSALAHEGAAPNAPIVSIRTSNEHGQSRVSDVIAAADWILANKAQHNIRVANFSLARADVTSSHHDPLNRAVERLWFSGVVVVAASGNYGSATGPVKVKAPGNDPFVITVGATDQAGTAAVFDDTVPSWSAYGHSMVGFAKPDVSAPGRYLVGPVPMEGTLATALPERVLAPGYMWMSGTSFSSGIVAGVAAQLLARHPDWSPDQVKGALMLTAQVLPTQGWKGGVGEVNAAAAAALSVPPNPNSNLYRFVVVAADGTRTFDGAAFDAHVAANPTWSASTWTESTWTESSWNESTWSESSWNESTWTESTWTESTWTESTWTESTWTESTWVE